MSVVQILSRAGQPAAPGSPVEPAARAASPEGPAVRTAAGLQPQSDPYPLDRACHAMLARFTGGISPAALSLAWLDWSSHLAAAPQRQMEITHNVLRDSARLLEASVHATPP